MVKPKNKNLHLDLGLLLASEKFFETFLTTKIDHIPWFDWLKKNMIVFKESICL